MRWSPPQDFFASVKTPRLVVRSFRMDDIDAMFETVNVHRESLLPWLSWAQYAHRDKADTEAWISAQVLQDQRPMAVAGASVGLFCDGTFAGGLSINDVQASAARAAIGYWLAPPFRGRGLMTEAVRHWLSYLFEGVGLKKIAVHCAGGNEASAAIPRRIGLVNEVRLRSHHYVEGLGVQDELVFGVLRSEWDCTGHQLLTSSTSPSAS